MNEAFSLDGVFFRRGTRVVLSDFSLETKSGEVLALLGPSGSGKTTVLRLLLGLEAPERGKVRVCGEVVSEPGRIVRPPEERGLAMVFQDLALWPHLTVYGNLAFGLEARGVPRDESERRITEILMRLALSAMAERLPGELSGGERQRVAIGRALVLAPVAVLLDEPLSNLDVVLRRELLDLFRELLKERGVAALYVTHEPREAARLGDRLAVMSEGRVVQVGTLAELAAHPAAPLVSEMLEGFA